MRLSTKGRYAVTAMVDPALRTDRGPVALIAIGQRLNISLSYMEVLFSMMRRRGLVAAVRGKGGGYLLARPAEKISLADIITAVDSPIAATGCGGKGDCQGTGTGHCMTHELWTSFDAKLIECLTAVSLKELADDRRSTSPLSPSTDARADAPADALAK